MESFYNNRNALTAAILRDMTNGVLVLDANNRIQYVNAAGKRILEQEANPLEGTAYGQFFIGDEKNDAFHQFILDAVYDKEKTHSGIVTYITPTAEKTLKVSTSFIFDSARRNKVGVTVVFTDITEQQRLTRLRNTFGKYVEPRIIDTLIEGGGADESAGEKRPVAVLFADVRGFTTMAEILHETPETIVQILNEYLDLSSFVVFKNGGSIDKFVGDAVMALFNGFTRTDDYVYKAVKAAWEIARDTAALNTYIKEKYNVDIGFGVGVHCGEAIVGDLGTSFRKDYTAIGDTVNTAARLESNAKSGQVLISQHVHEAIRHRVQAESIGKIPLKGKSNKLEIFSVIGVCP